MKHYPRSALLAWLLLLAASLIQLGRTSVNTDLAAFLPQSLNQSQQLLLQQMRDGVAARIMLIAIEGDDPERLARTSNALAHRLIELKLFTWVNNGDPALLRAERELLMRYRYLLSPALEPSRFSSASLRVALEDALRLAASPAGMVVRSSIASDPTKEFLSVIESLGGTIGPALRSGVWFSADGKRALLLAETHAAGFDAERQQQAIDSTRSAFTALNGSAADRLLLTGPGVFAAESRAVIERDSWQLSVIAGVLVIAILGFVYRSIRTVSVAALPVITGLVVGTAAVSLVFGSVHAITLGFGATLIGEAVDYPSYLFTHAARGERIRDALERIWPTLRLAVLTTVFGGMTMLASGFPGLSQLGLFSIVGVLAAGLMTRWVLPTLAGRSEALEPPGMLDLAWKFPLHRAARSIAWVLGLLSIALIASRYDQLWSDDLADLSPVSAQSRALDRDLRNELAAPDVRYLMVTTGATQNQALERSEAVAASLQALIDRKILSGFDLAANYLPSLALQSRRRAALPGSTTLSAALAEALQGLPFRAGVFAPFLSDVENTRSGAPLTLADLGLSSLAARIHTLLFESNGRWVALIALRGVSDPVALAAVAAAFGTPEVFFFDLKETSHRMINDYRDESLKLTAIGVLAITGVLLWGLRRMADALRVIVPVILALAIAVAGLALSGEKLSLFHVVALLLVIGIGLNYSLFFNRPEPIAAVRRRTALALAVCSLTTIAAFGALALSATPVLRAIGLTVSAGAIASLILSALFARADR